MTTLSLLISVTSSASEKRLGRGKRFLSSSVSRLALKTAVIWVMFLVYHFPTPPKTNNSSVLDFQLGGSWQLPGLQQSLATFLKKSTAVQIGSQAHHQESLCASQGRSKTARPTSWILVTARKTNFLSPRRGRMTVTLWVHTSWELAGKHQMIRFSGACTQPAQHKTFASGLECVLHLCRHLDMWLHRAL